MRKKRLTFRGNYGGHGDVYEDSKGRSYLDEGGIFGYRKRFVPIKGRYGGLSYFPKFDTKRKSLTAKHVTVNFRRTEEPIPVYIRKGKRVKQVNRHVYFRNGKGTYVRLHGREVPVKATLDRPKQSAYTL